MIDYFHRVCVRWKLKVNVEKSKVMVFEKKKMELCDFGISYRMSVPHVGR